MRLLYLTSIVATIFLILLNIVSTSIYSFQYNLPIHKTLYVDRNLSDGEFITITNAALEWNFATNGMVSYDVIKLPQKGIDPNNSIIIVLLSADFPDIISLDTASEPEEIKHLGYYYNRGFVPYIGLVTERITDDDYKTVILHELGHSLGLKHSDAKTGVGQLMYYNISFGASFITEDDLKQFCQLYHCDSSQLRDK